MDPDLGYETVLTSKPFIATLIAESGMTYKLEPEKKAFRDKQIYAKNPVVFIWSEENNQSVAFDTDKPEKKPGKWARETTIPSKPVDQPSVAAVTTKAEQQ